MSTKTTLNPLPFVSHPTPERRLLVLASTSRYRRTLLAQLGLPFDIAAPDTDEAAWPGESPAATALRLAEAKARSVAARHPGALIIGSDQVADCEGRAIGKPESHDDAVVQLDIVPAQGDEGFGGLDGPLHGAGDHRVDGLARQQRGDPVGLIAALRRQRRIGAGVAADRQAMADKHELHEGVPNASMGSGIGSGQDLRP